MTGIHDMLLGPGELASLLAARRLALTGDSPLASAGLLDTAAAQAPARTDVPAAALDAALAALAQPERVLDGRRGERGNPAWPFFICTQKGTSVLLAPEPDGAVRLRFPFSDQDLIAWLADPFRIFAVPEIPIRELPALAAPGLLVLLSLADLFRGRFPQIDPDWQNTAPVSFTASDVAANLRVGLAGDDTGSLIQGWLGLGFSRPGSPGHEDVPALLYVFANEGWLTVDISGEEPVFTLSDAFVWTIMTMAWWDLSLAVAPAKGEAVALIQGLALWRFITEPDGRIRLTAISGESLKQAIAAARGAVATAPTTSSSKTVVPAPRPAAPIQPASGATGSPGMTHATICAHCRAPLSAGVRFCPRCGKPTEPAIAAAKFCRKCGNREEAAVRFCGKCGTPFQGK